ncbi:MAG: zinc ribbon domain-containing protein [Bacillota bacterium]
MYAIVLILVLGIVLYLIGQPLVRPEAGEDTPLLPGRVDLLETERERVFAALAEVENDYQMHKLSEADYQELKGQYARQAVQYLKAAGSGPPRATRAPAPRTASAPRRLPADLRQVEAEAEAEVALALDAVKGKPAAAPGSLHCPHCGAELLSAGQKFCHICGKTQGNEA